MSLFAAQPLDALVDRYMEMAATLEELDDIPRPPRDHVTRTLAVSMAELSAVSDVAGTRARTS